MQSLRSGKKYKLYQIINLMGDKTWLISAILALVGFYLIYVELGLSEKTFLLYLGFAFLLPLVAKIIMSFISK